MIAGLIPVIGNIIDKVIPDPAQKAQLQLDLAKLADADAQRTHEAEMGQIEVNKIEASSASLFVAGWRPAIGWTCAAGFAYSTIIGPMFSLGMPDTNFLSTVLLGVLGLTGTMRTIEKVKGVAVGMTPIPPKEAGQPTAPFVKKKKKFLGIF
jgi:hypothetical protein